MILKDLNLIGFGKFKNKNIELKEGINLIYGENEAGKSTIHSFIHGMFYGFLKPNVKSALYLEEHEKYNPWDGSRYAGVLSFKYNSRLYRIERDFTRGQERTKVFDGNTGEDITNRIDNGPARVLQPGIHFFGFNTRIFSNTISIKQLGSKTEDKLGQEVIERLINVSQSLDDDISIDKAILELKDRMAEIGTERAPTRPYARNLKSIEKLQEERERILLEKDDYESYLEEKDRLSNELKKEENKLSCLKDNLKKLETYEKAIKLEEARLIQGDIEELEKKVEKLSVYSHLSMEEYKEAINLSNSIEYMETNIKEYEFKLKETEDKLKSMEDNIKETKTHDLDQITKDYNLYEELEEERNTFIYNMGDNRLEFLKRGYNDHTKEMSKFKSLQWICLIISIFSYGIMALVPSIRFYILLVAIGSMLVWQFYRYKIKKLKVIIKDLNTQIAEIEEKEGERKKSLAEIEGIQRKLLMKYNVSTKLEFKRIFDRVNLEYLGREENILLYNELSTSKKFLLDRIRQLKLDMESNLGKLKHSLEKNKVENLEDFSHALEKKSLYEKHIKELESKKELLNKTLGQTTMEALVLELENEQIDKSIVALDKNQLRYEIDRSNEMISDYRVALRGVEENINILGKDISRLVEIEEELERKLEYKEKLENEYKAIELATNTIESISKDIHDEFAPDINNKVGKIIEKITNGKYNRIRVDESLNITVENPATKELIKIKDLSGGTIDQLYFSLRFSLINSMVENNFPLILDDCFIQYDDNRLRNIMEFLVDISGDRQVILFTCHNREKKILDQLKVEFNFIGIG
ncbi:MAG: AAA family ATPase [Tissierellia bacterium]|nr:AAA family ATPase [Tissierellia bacterium]